MAAKIKAIVTGATGMVGEGVLHVCLNHPDVEKVVVIGRKTCGVNHPKLKEIILTDFFNPSTLQGKLSEYSACFFCLGVSSVGMSEEQYFKLTHTLTIGFAQECVKQNPEMTFCYVSGASTDSTEQGKTMWARVKGKTENDLTKIFKNAFNFRPAGMIPMEGMKNTLKIYKYLGWLIPVFKLITPDSICKLEDVGKAMVNAATKGYDKKILEVPDIVALANK